MTSHCVASMILPNVHYVPMVFNADRLLNSVTVLFLLSQQPFIFSPPQVRVGVSTQTAPPLLPAPNKGTAPQLPQSALDALNKFKEAGEKMATEDEAGHSSSPEVVALSSDDEDKDESTRAVDLTVSPEDAGKGEQKSLAVSDKELRTGVHRYLSISYVHCLNLKAKLPVCMYIQCVCVWIACTCGVW